jgi:hypothetical protein
MLDVAGHYARPDVFELIVHRGAHPMIRVVGNPSRQSLDKKTATPLKAQKAKKAARRNI